MTVVVKVGGKSQATPDMVEEFVRQADDYFHDEPVVWIASAIGDTTDRLKASLTDEKSISLAYPHCRFLEKEEWNEYRRAQAKFRKSKVVKDIPAPVNKAAYLMSGERLAAVLLSAAIRRRRKRGAVFLDYDDPRFPIVSSDGENYLSANFDIERSRARADYALELLAKNDIVLPGFGGISGRYVKTFGRGGSDESAFGCGNILRAAGIYICTDVSGIKQAVASGVSGETVEVMDVEEAKAGAFLGAKLPSEQALMPLEVSYMSGRRPEVYILNAHDFGGPRTKIVARLEPDGVKFIAGRKIDLYAVVSGSKSSLLDLERYLMENGFDYLVAVKSGTRAEIGIFGKGSDVAAEEFGLLCQRFGISYDADTGRAIVGIVGGGIKNTEGIDERLYGALWKAGVNVLSSHDYSDISTGSIINAVDLDRAITSIYSVFFDCK